MNTNTLAELPFETGIKHSIKLGKSFQTQTMLDGSDTPNRLPGQMPRGTYIPDETTGIHFHNIQYDYAPKVSDFYDKDNNNGDNNNKPRLQLKTRQSGKSIPIHVMLYTVFMFLFLHVHNVVINICHPNTL